MTNNLSTRGRNLFVQIMYRVRDPKARETEGMKIKKEFSHGFGNEDDD